MTRTIGSILTLGLCLSVVACKKETSTTEPAELADAAAAEPAAAEPPTPDAPKPDAPKPADEGFVKKSGTSECERLRNCAKTWIDKEVSVKFCSLDARHARLAAHLHEREGVTALVSAECKLGCGTKAGCATSDKCVEQWNQTGTRHGVADWVCSKVTGECEHTNKEMYECKRTFGSVYGNVFCNCVRGA